MTDTRTPRGPSLDAFDLSRCCAEAQADGVPCPTLGRDCQICERAIAAETRETPSPLFAIRPVGND